nr:unnamed protein product [Callosobruchus analis]
MTWNGSTLLKHTLQFLGVLSAVFTAMTRVSDYKHHWSDVLCGLLLGALVASVTARFFSSLFKNNHSNSSRMDQSELLNLNGNRGHAI